MPASRSPWRSPVISAIAQPCEKPATTMRSAAMPRAFSLAISASIVACERRRPASSSRATRSATAMSYQAGIW